MLLSYPMLDVWSYWEGPRSQQLIDNCVRSCRSPVVLTVGLCCLCNCHVTGHVAFFCG